MPRVSLLPGQQTGQVPGRVSQDHLVCSFFKNIFIMDNSKQIRSKENSKHLPLSSHDYQHPVSSFPPFIPSLALHSVFHASFLGMVAHLLPSRGTNLSCSIVTEGYVCAALTSCHSAQSRLPLQAPMPMPRQNPALPQSPEAAVFLI